MEQSEERVIEFLGELQKEFKIAPKLYFQFEKLLADYRQLQQQRDELLAVLEKYSKHHHWCNSQGIGQTNYKCSCGLVKAIASAERSKK